MKVVTKNRFLRLHCKKIRKGAVFIYPTDTIYGIGCDATNARAVSRVRAIKRRSSRPFSVAVPSKKWVKDNFFLTADAKKWLKKLPGPYTLLLKLKNKKAVAKAVHPSTDVVGIRIPDNWFAKVVKQLNVPIVSTSANITSRKHMTSIKDLNKSVAEKVDFIVYEGKKSGRPSSIVDLSGGSVRIINR
ncbi:threonylcarbamoyl-AMP synthase [Candidatus Woesearchaeota archaeon]|nr:threonylcarbamoyl-AMP synthase [Candidatus Woesearchaeota archaeon]